jgi:hypothetical protein
MNKFILTLLIILMTFSKNFSQDFWDKTNGLDSITIYSLAINSNGDIFAGADTSYGVYRSTDNGINWTNLGLMNLKTTGIVIKPSGEILLITLDHFLGGGVFHSTDNGNSWTNMGFTGAGTSIAINSSGDIFVGAFNIGVFRSTDNGVNWVQINQGLIDLSLTALLINSSGSIFAGTYLGGVFRSTNNGDNWVQINQGLTNNTITSLAINSNGDIFTGTEGGGLFRYTENGDNWVPISQGLAGESLFIFSLAINSNGNILAGTAGGIFRSTDNGDDWAQINQGLTNDDVHSLAINSNGDVFAGTEDGIFRSISITMFLLTINVNNGWNMVSIPGLNTPDQNINTWWAFRDMGANVFKYAGGYTAVTTAIPGTGYWMKHAGARIYNTGEEWPAGGIQTVPHDPLSGASGWNLIGGYELSVTATNVTTNPPGLQSGPIYRYSGGYAIATTLDPGYGYWIKLNAAGQIIIPETMAKGEVVEYFPEDWGRIILTDATGINYTLYAVKGEVDLTQYELPPAPPTGMFDIRYNSGRIAEDINSSVKTIDMSGVTYPLTVRVEGMDIRLMDEIGKAINVNLKAGEDVVISDATVMKLMVSGELIPAQYSLEQNYPNPFNPNTVIKFSLPEDLANVKLSIYNALGEKVAELVNTSLTAGNYQYQWNAQNVATGMYIYELRTDKFASVKKMILMK